MLKMKEFQEIVFRHRNELTARIIDWLRRKARFEGMFAEGERRGNPILEDAIRRASRIPQGDREVLAEGRRAAIGEIAKKNLEARDKKMWERIEAEECRTFGSAFKAGRSSLCDILGDGENHRRDTSDAYSTLRAVLNRNLFGDAAMPFTRPQQDELVCLALSLAKDEILLCGDIMHVVITCKGLGIAPPAQIVLIATTTPALFLVNDAYGLDVDGLAGRAGGRKLEASLALIELLYPEEQDEIGGRVFNFASC